MFVPFEDLATDARIWIYQSSRPLSEAEQRNVDLQGREFIEQWAAHGQPLKASIKTFYSHFVVVGVDEHTHLPSGCSIDQSVAFIRSLESLMGVDFFDRTKVSVFHDNSVMLKDLSEIKSMIKDGKMAENTLIFDNLIQSKGSMDQWIKPIRRSWLGRYFTQTAGNLGS